MKKILLLLACAGLFGVSCSKKTTPKTEDVEVFMPCSGNEFMTNDKYLRASATGLGGDINIAKKKALANALDNKVVISNNQKSYPINIALIAHGYNLYDERVSMKIFEKLEKLDVRVFTAEQLTLEQMKEGMNSMRSRLYWANEYEITGASAHYLQDRNIDGLITINAFGCGPDSLMLERIARYSRKSNKPILHLSIDEHTGEAGFVTRIEAFVDMLYRKKRSKILDKIKINESRADKYTDVECRDLIQ
jgi:predicted nucleotide-binding protein (sugar kinase/HSP70/actin superfamily)